jgi:hypothetical protein
VLAIPSECVDQPCYVFVIRGTVDPIDRVQCDVEVANDVVSLFASNQDRFVILSRTQREEVILKRLPDAQRHHTRMSRLLSPLPSRFNTTLWGQMVMQRNQDFYQDMNADPAQIFYRIDTVKGAVPLIAFSYSAYRDARLTIPSSETPQDVGDRCEAWFVHLLTITRGLRRMDPNMRLSSFSIEEIGNVIGDMVTLPGRCLIYIPDTDRGEGRRSAPQARSRWTNNSAPLGGEGAADQWIPLSYQPRFGRLGYDCEDHSHFILYLLYALQTRSTWTHPDLQTIYTFLQHYFIAQAMSTIREQGSTYGAHVMVVCTDCRYIETMMTQHKPFHSSHGTIMPLLVIDSTQHSDSVWTRESMSRVPSEGGVTASLRRRILASWPSATEMPYRVMKSRISVGEMHHVSMSRYGTVSQLLGVTPNGTATHVMLGQHTKVGVTLSTLAAYDDTKTYMTPIVIAALNEQMSRVSLVESAKHIPYGHMPRAPEHIPAASYEKIYPSANTILQAPFGSSNRLVLRGTTSTASSAEWLTFCIRSIDYEQYRAEIEACIQTNIKGDKRIVHRRDMKLAIDNDHCQAMFIELLCRSWIHQSP